MAKKGTTDTTTGRLFSDRQPDFFEKSAEEAADDGLRKPVECLGTTFASDAARRDYFLKELRGKLRDPEFRKLPGFPRADDEDILLLSDPPYFTACPNPFIVDFVKAHSRGAALESETSKPPFTGELGASKRHAVYMFHPYHTKVPPDVIRRLIEHYTSEGELVLDGFSGSGMTGVAAREANRDAILVDLSPISTFVSSVNTSSTDWRLTVRTLAHLLAESEKQWLFLYETNEAGKALPVNYYVWSDVFTCPECVHEFPFFPHGVVHHGTKVETRKSFPCPSCAADLNVRRIERVLVHEGKKRALVWVNAGTGRARVNREPNKHDLDLAAACEQRLPEEWYPTDPIDPAGYSAKLAQLGDKKITDISRFLSRRNLIVFADLWARVGRIEDPGVRNLAKATLTSIYTVISERQGYFGGGGGMSGNLYMPIVRMERNVYASLRRKLKKVEETGKLKDRYRSNAIVSTQSTSSLVQLPSASIDYIYTDPPFGANIIYSEMNLILEGWLRVRTDDTPEAVIDQSRSRGFEDYASLIRECFAEYFRVLKPGRWMTVEFHNTQATVWNLIQTAIGECGFVVAQVGVLDKGSTTILADIRPGAAKYDLLISAYKPSRALEERFRLDAGTENGCWDFVDHHLSQLPILVERSGGVEAIADRERHLLFDKMVAFHVQRGVTVPLSAADFYRGLADRYPERDSMYFLPDQLSEYDRRRAKVRELVQGELFVSDEASAIQWLRSRLTARPQTAQELHPEFMRQIQAWAKYERTIELRELLETNFLCFTGTGPAPPQIMDHLRGMASELADLGADDPEVARRARDWWYVPDVRHQADLEQLRQRTLLREFESYKSAADRRLKVFRSEAVRAGFKAAYDEKDYATILEIAAKLPEEVVQTDAALLMYYDVAAMRTE